MKNNIFTKRLWAGIIDHAIVSTLAFAVCGFMVTSVFAEVFDQQMAPFVVIQILLYPISLLIQLVTSPQAYGNVSVVYMLFAICFFIEVFYYAVFEILPVKKTPGYSLSKIRLDYNAEQRIFLRILIRNILKVFSRYLYCIPFLALLFSKSGNAPYDSVTKIKVVATDE